MLYARSENLVTLRKPYPSQGFTVKYYVLRGRLAFEREAQSFEEALTLIEVLRLYDDYHELYRKSASYAPFAELFQLDEDGDEVCVARLYLLDEPPWKK